MGDRADRDQVGCARCDFLAAEVMRLREDRNAYRRMYIMLRRLVAALIDVLAEKRGLREQDSNL